MTPLFDKQDWTPKQLYDEIIRKFEEEELTDGEPEPYEQWKREINFLINMYNIKSKYAKIENVK